MCKKFSAGLKKFLKKKGVYASLIIGILQLGLEKLLGMDFICPCNPHMNLVFTISYFLIPALFSSSLMFYIQSPQCKKKRSFSILSCLTPAVIWIMLLFFDGQYFACARTSWERLEKENDSTWCVTLVPSSMTAENLPFFTLRNISQTAGMGMLFLISLILVCFGCKRYGHD